MKRIEKSGEEGTAIVEAAIILLMLFVLIFGSFEAGRFMNTQQVLTNSAREGARLAIAPLSGTNTLPTQQEIEDAVNVYLDSAGITDATVTVTPVLVDTGDVETAYTRVEVESPYQVLTIDMFDMLEITLRGEALMRNETSE